MVGRPHLLHYSGCALIKNRINLLDVRAGGAADPSLAECPRRGAKATER